MSSAAICIHYARDSKKAFATGIDVAGLEQQIDELAGELWGLCEEELKHIKRSLEAIR